MLCKAWDQDCYSYTYSDSITVITIIVATVYPIQKLSTATDIHYW